MSKMITIAGTIIRGHGVASGQGNDPRFPEGTIRPQKPYFFDLGLDLEHCFMGTLNVSIAPKIFRMVNPLYNFPRVKWTDAFPPETFSFSPCTVLFAGNSFDCFVYYPHPDTKPDFFQPPSMLEIIGPKIDNLSYDAKIELVLDTAQIEINE